MQLCFGSFVYGVLLLVLVLVLLLAVLQLLLFLMIIDLSNFRWRQHSEVSVS